MKKILSKLIFVISLLIPSAAFAHEQWFGPADPLAQMPEFFTTWSAARIVLLVGFFVMLAVAIVIRPFLSRFKIARLIEEKITSVSSLAPQLVRGATGVLLIVASTQGILFGPDLRLESIALSISIPLWATQYVLGFAFVLGLFVRPAAIAGVLLYATSFVFFPVVNLLSYLALVGLFVYLFFVGTTGNSVVLFKNKLSKFYSWIAAHQDWGFIALRTLFGLSFIAMGIAFKLTHPQMALALMEKVPLNFMSMLGFTAFTNEMFVYAAGLTEVLFGLLYVFNILPRIVSVKLCLLFSMTIFIFGLRELFGHLPLIAGFFTVLTYQKKKS